MQAIQSGFYSSHDKFFEIISNIFGPPTLHGSIKHKTVVKLLTVKEIRCLFISALFLFSINENFLHAAYKCDAIFRGCCPVERQKLGFLIFSIFGQALSKNDKNRSSPLL
jgi:hypothetical protein